MKRVMLVVVCTGVVAAAVVLRAQDAAKVDPGHYKVLIDNPSVRVLRINYAPGAQSVMHQHPDSIVIPMSASKVEFTLPDGTKQTQDMANDSAMYSSPGTHNPKNVGTTPVTGILVEFKGAALAKRCCPRNDPACS